MIREELIPKKDEKLAEKLKNIILEIEEVLEEDCKKTFVEKKIEELNQLLEPGKRTVGIYEIQYYYSWTSLDGFVNNLALQVPSKIELSEEEIVDLILYIQENLIKATDVEEYVFDFYYEYFCNNYSEEIYDEIFKDNVNVVELAKKMKNFKKSVIVL